MAARAVAFAIVSVSSPSLVASAVIDGSGRSPTALAASLALNVGFVALVGLACRSGVVPGEINGHSGGRAVLATLAAIPIPPAALLLQSQPIGSINQVH